MTFKPRPKQQEVLDYSGGRMGVAAVPGSGKTRTLSYLAARLVAEGHLKDDQEVLVVTLVNSAVNHFARQVGDFVKERGLLPGFGYRVRTLHGLANDIVRERPALVGLKEGFSIADERATDDILNDAVMTWLRINPRFGEAYLSHDLEGNQAEAALRNHWPKEAQDIAKAFIRQAKDWQLTPDDVKHGLSRFGQPLPLAAMCHEVYINYQRGLNYRGAVDFQDLIRLALKALKLDEAYLKRLQSRWPYILEDEAQDSSLLQEEILRLLAGKKGNWVRVGDPNQSIYETFTTASPQHLRDFLNQRGVKKRELPNSGRSTQSIIDLANALIDWSMTRHPVAAVRERALRPPKIEPSPPGDPQPNPPDDPERVHLSADEYTSDLEIKHVTRSLAGWLPRNQDKTAAVLVPRNERGSEMVKALKASGLEVVELLRSTSSTRETAERLAALLEALVNPAAGGALARAYQAWRWQDNVSDTRVEAIRKAISKCRNVEDYLWPRAGRDWLESAAVNDLSGEDSNSRDELLAFRALVRRWQDAVLLPVDQLVLTLGQDLFSATADLAIAHSLALFLRRGAESNPHWRLPDFASELRAVAENRRRVPDISEDATGYDPERHKGKVTVATMHTAKGLEWDRVYLMSVNNYDFPSAEPQDSFISERWFVRDKLNLQAEALAQLAALRDDLTFAYEEGAATYESRLEYAAERLRLLYVGITRARRELVITSNTGRDNHPAFPATPFLALQVYWENKRR